MSGRKQKSISDPNLASNHDAGATVILTQNAVDPKYGVLSFPVIDHTSFYFNYAEYHLKEAERIRQEIIAIPVGRANNRFVKIELAGEIFHHGQLVVIFSYLALEYFGLSCMQGFQKTKEWKNKRLDQKIKDFIPKELGIPKLPQNLCSAFGELEERRHSLNHPNYKNMIHWSDTEWDTCHSAWMIIGNYERVYKGAKDIYHHLHVPFKAEMLKRNPPRPVTLTGVTRGIRFENPAKKPAKNNK
ncbi:MAG: hypothetical protein NT068_01370 [Candidatus Nomurabacteria bacterium]|nr:hypothetical protein [Candidatus Nomurabacteria bacterium]